MVKTKRTNNSKYWWGHEHLISHPCWWGHKSGQCCGLFKNGHTLYPSVYAFAIDTYNLQLTLQFFPPKGLFLHSFLESRFGHVTCLGQWDISKCDTRKDLKRPGMLEFVPFYAPGKLPSSPWEWTQTSLLDYGCPFAKLAPLLLLTTSQLPDKWMEPPAPSWLLMQDRIQLT